MTCGLSGAMLAIGVVRVIRRMWALGLGASCFCCGAGRSSRFTERPLASPDLTERNYGWWRLAAAFAF